MTSGEYITPNEYDIPNVNNDVPAQYCDAPEHMNVDDNLENIDLNQYWEQPADDRGRMIEEGMGPGPEINVEQPLAPEFADNCDPPEHLLSDGIELSKNTDNSEDSVKKTDDEDIESNNKFDFSDDSINNINDKLRDQGYQFERIDNIDVNDLEPDFWNNSGKGGGERNEDTWKENMQNCPEIFDRINQGESLDDIRGDDKLNLFDDKHSIKLDTSDPNSIRVSDGRHRIAMAQRLGYTHLPIKQ